MCLVFIVPSSDVAIRSVAVCYQLHEPLVIFVTNWGGISPPLSLAIVPNVNNDILVQITPWSRFKLRKACTMDTKDRQVCT